jgi:hypothetical protein
MSPIDKIKELLVRIVKDDAFRSEIESQPTPEAQTEVLEKSGYLFGAEELEAATIKILELAEQGLFPELTDTELNAVFGGQTLTRLPFPTGQAMYGVSIPPTAQPPTQNPIHPPTYPPYYDWWWRIRNRHRPHPRPTPPVQALYGASIGSMDTTDSTM